MFSIHFGLPKKFFSLKNRKLFLKIENKEEKQLPNIPLIYAFRRLCEYVKILDKLKIQYRNYGIQKNIEIEMDTDNYR